MISLISLATSLTGLNTPTITFSGLVNSPLAHHLMEHEISHILFSLIKGPRRSRLTRAQSRKTLNRRRRWFTDNIIMHHKRLHDRNRAIVVASVRAKVLAKKAAASGKMVAEPSHKWRDRMEGSKERSTNIRGRIDARRARARSRWISVQEQTHDKPSPQPSKFMKASDTSSS
ncbi:MAG: hypothetical protein EXR06_00420 [Rickettsiales bacterium]|nr:hypothetical protein [Rickettsiales bacterium]